MLHGPDIYALSRALHTAMTMTASERHFGKTVETLYNQRAWLVMMANSYVQNMEASQDIVNDSFIALLENIDRLDDAVLKSFLATTVKNKCLNYLRRVNCEKIIHRNLKIRAIDAYNMSLLESDSRDSGMFAPFRHVRDSQDSRCPERIAERLSPSRALSPDAEKQLNILDVFFARLPGFYSIMIPYCIK